MHQLRPYFFSGLVGVFAILAVAAGVDAVRQSERYFRLSKAGVAADARVLETYWAGRGRSYRAPHVAYAFRSRDGAMWRGVGRVTRAQFEQLHPGGIIRVRFDAADPGTSAPDLTELLSNALWNTGGVIVTLLFGIVFAREWRRRHQALNPSK
jgi:hypothetical protein